MKLRNLLIFFILVSTYFSLQLAPPLNGKYYFAYLLFIFCLAFFLWGLFKKDYTIVGLIIPIGNALTRFSPNPYSTVSILSISVFLGYLFSIKKENLNISEPNNERQQLVPFVVIFFYFVVLISGITHILVLSKPGIVWVVNRAGMTNLEIIYHIVCYALLPYSCAIILFLFILFYSDDITVNRLFLFFSIGIIISGIVAILQSLKIIRGIFGFVIPWEERANGLFSDFNAFALCLGLLLVVFAYKIFIEKKFRLKIVYFVSCIIGIIALFLTGTRSGFLSLCISIFLVILVLVNKPIKILGTIFLLGICLFFISKYSKIYAVKRVLQVFNRPISQQIQGRKIFWNTGLKLFIKSPLVGNGIKSVYKEFSNINPVWIQSDNACNVYIHYLAEIGILGSIIFLSIVIFILYKTFFYFKQKKFFNLVAGIAVLSFLIVCFFGSHLDAEEVLLIFWFYLGVLFKEDINLGDVAKKYIKLAAVVLLTIFFSITLYSTVRKINNFDIFSYSNFAGLYKKEKIDNKECFWTDKFVLIKLDSFYKKTLAVEFNAFGMKNQYVDIFVDDKKYDTARLDGNSWFSINIKIEQSNKILKIIPKKNFVPAGKYKRFVFPFHGKDYRCLGVLFRYYLL